MPKNKSIEVRHKKRKSYHKLDKTSGNTTERLKREPTNVVEGFENIRHPKFKAKGLHEKVFFDFNFAGKIQKRIILVAIFFSLITIVIGLVANQLIKWYKVSLITKPLGHPKVISEENLDHYSQSLFWGSYRPGLYFGMKHRSPQSLLFGLIWTTQDPENARFRHQCDVNDELQSYNWIEHDGISFGIQQIVDTHHILTTSFIKKSAESLGSDWSARISAVATNRTSSRYLLSLIVYFYYPGAEVDFFMTPMIAEQRLVGLQGSTGELGDFKVLFHPTSNSIQLSHLNAYVPREDAIMETLYSGIGLRREPRLITLTGAPRVADGDRYPNAWFYELTIDPPHMSDLYGDGAVALEIEFTRQHTPLFDLKGKAYSDELSRRSHEFNERFAEKFRIDKSKFTSHQINLTKVVVGNLLGGLGYFYGSSLVQVGSKPVENWPAGLFTATPSRSVFPRGFLWDEGFHGLVLVQWDPLLAMETVGSWLDLMNANGWILREQILGWEARSRVPSEFLIQSDVVANPPTLVLVVEALLDKLPKLSAEEANHFRKWSMLVLPRLHTWYQWFNTTQTGPVPFSYRWRGRNPEEISQLNPLTLSSGLDDYPRASHPSVDERHLDLRCWMTLFARVVAKLASVVAQYIQTDPEAASQKRLEETRSWIVQYTTWAELLSDPQKLDSLHWSEQFERYADYGLHTDSVRLELPELSVRQSYQTPSTEQLKPVRVVGKPPSMQLITSSFGYVNIFPFLLRILPPNSPRLSKILSDLSDPQLTWSDHGLRSIDTNSFFYGKSNTNNDPPYWRGAIWVNINYLAIQALRFYAHHPRTPTSVAKTAASLSAQLSQNIVRTVLSELERTGYLWEQYNDQTGRGQRAHPFAGWTSLVSLIVSDIN